MMENIHEPIRREDGIVTFSREHHYCLLLTWKIRKGLNNNIPLKRIKKYSDWFFKEYLHPHFEAEEKYLFPLLENNEFVKKALAEHRRLVRLFNDESEIEKSLHRIEEELERHVRFEERELFKLIQETIPEKQLLCIGEEYKEKTFVENTEDEFWE